MIGTMVHGRRDFGSMKWNLSTVVLLVVPPAIIVAVATVGRARLLGESGGSCDGVGPLIAAALFGLGYEFILLLPGAVALTLALRFILPRAAPRSRRILAAIGGACVPIIPMAFVVAGGSSNPDL